MTFQEILAQAIDWLQRDKRITYRALKRQFDLDDEYLEDLKEELIAPSTGVTHLISSPHQNVRQNPLALSKASPSP